MTETNAFNQPLTIGAHQWAFYTADGKIDYTEVMMREERVRQMRMNRAREAMVTRANGDSHCLEQSKKLRRLERRFAGIAGIALVVAVMVAAAPTYARGCSGHHATMRHTR